MSLTAARAQETKLTDETAIVATPDLADLRGNGRSAVSKSGGRSWCLPRVLENDIN